jgi:hypothetical protein
VRPTCNLPQAARHLTSEEDSYGNEKGSQKEIQQQFQGHNFALAFLTQQQIAKRQIQPFHTEQQRKEEHPRFGGEKVQRAQVQLEKIFRP